MPVKVGLEFGAIVGLHDVEAEGQATEDVVDDGDGRALTAGIEAFSTRMRVPSSIAANW